MQKKLRHVAIALLFAALFPGLSGHSRAGTALDDWRIEVNSVRGLAENDTPRAYKEAQRLQANIPADATPADQARVLNLLSRVEVYSALTDPAEEHAKLALEVAVRQGDVVGQAEAQLNLAINAINQARIDASIAATTRSMELLDGVDRPDLLGEAMLRMSMMYRRMGDFDNSVTMAMQAMEIAKRDNNPLALVYAHQGLAVAFDQSGHYAEAREYYQKMRDQARAAHSKLQEAYAVQGLGGTIVALGDAASGERLMREGVAMFRALHSPFSLNHAQFGLADLLRRQGRYAEALKLQDEMISIYGNYPNQIGLWFTLNARSTTLQAAGRVDAARADAERAYALARKIGWPLYLSESARRMAAIAATLGNHQRAYQLSAEAADMADKAAREKAGARIVQLAQRYESEAKQRQIDELSRRNAWQSAELQQHAMQQRWLWTVFGGCLLALTGTMLFLSRLRRSNISLAELNAQLGQTKNKLQATLDALPDLLFEVGLDGRYYDGHSPRGDLLAAPVEMLLGKTVQEILPPDAAAVCMSALREAQAAGKSMGKSYELNLPHGKSWFELSITRKQRAAGQEPRFIVLVRDITERKLSEDALRESEEKYRTLIQKIQAAVIVHGADTKILTFNPVAQKILGLREEQMYGKAAIDPVWKFYHEDGRPATPDEYPVNKVLASRTALKDYVLGVHRPDHENDVWALVNADPVFGKDGEITQVIVTFIDITQRKRTERVLVLLNLAVNSSSEATFLMNEQGRFVYVNDAACRSLDYSREELLQMGPTDIDPCLTPESFEEMRQDIFTVGPSKGILESQHRTRDGRVFPIEVSAAVIELDGAKFCLSMARDITRRKSMENALRSSEEKYRSLAENSPDLIMRYDTGCKRVYVNPAYERDMGVPLASALQRTPVAQWRAISPPAEEYMSVLRQVMASGEPAEMTVSWPLPSDGTVAFYAVRFVAERDNEGRVTGVLAIGRNITAQRNAESALKEREQRYHEIFDNAVEGMYLLEVTEEGRFRNLDINPALARSTGIPREAMIGQFVDDTVPEEMGRLIVEKYRRCVAAGQTLSENIELDLPAGKRYYYSTITPIYYGGRVHRLIGISRDITELKRFERELEESRAQLRGLTARREEAREEERKYIAREVHDELGQILTGLKLNVSVLEHRYASGSKPMQEHLKETIMLTDRALGVARDVASALRPAALDMGIASALEWLAGRFSTNTGIECGVRVAEDECQLEESHAIALFRIVQESLTNVARHAKASKVCVTMEKDAQDYVLKVRDNGVGFDVGAKKMDSFGLVGIHERALMLGGTVVINSRPGSGTEIVVRIPTQRILEES